MTEREKEIEAVMSTIVSALEIHKLTLTADLDKKALIVIDTINNKRYGLRNVKEGGAV